MAETTQIVTNLGGRPSKMTPEVTTKLEEIFKVGGTVAQAVSCAGISDETYRRWCIEDEGFMARMQQAQHFADVMAKKVVVRTIIDDENDTNAKWWLEKREFKNNPTTQVAIQGGDMNIEFVS